MGAGGSAAASARPRLSRLHLLVGSTSAVAVVLLAVAAWSAAVTAPPLTAELLVVALLMLLIDVTAVDARIGRDVESYTWGELPVVLGLALLPPEHLVLVSLLVAGAYARNRQPLIKLAFNASSYTVGLALAAVTTAAVADPSWSHPERSLLALLAGTAVFSLWNKVSIDLAIALSGGTRLREVLRRGALPTFVVLAGNVALALGTLLLARRDHSLLLVAPVCVLLLAAANRWFLRTVQDRRVWQHLEAAGHELTVLDERAVAESALARVSELMQADRVEVRLHRAEGDHVLARTDEGEVETREEPRQLVGTGFVVTTEARSESTGPALVSTTAAVPLCAEGGEIGALILTVDAAVRLTARDRRWLLTYAGMLAVGVRNAQLHAQVEAQAEEHRRAAEYDGLTGLANRILLERRVTEALHRGAPFALLLMDLDRFKPVNDQYGHLAGDTVLRAVGERLSGALRQHDLAARLGGDEFAVLLNDPSDVQAAARRLQELVGAPVDLRTAVVSVGASIGVALAPVDGSSFEALVRAADEGMYRQKAAGGRDARVDQTAPGASRVVRLAERREQS